MGAISLFLLVMFRTHSSSSVTPTHKNHAYTNKFNVHNTSIISLENLR